MVERRFDNELDEIMYYIENGHNFLLNGGAGSGKTYSLVQLVKKISSLYPKANIACITYTNAAAIEIKNRAKIRNLQVSTIHDFLWKSIALYQKEMEQTLIKLINDPLSKIRNPNGDETFSCNFENGVQYKEYVKMKEGIISHDEVLILAHALYKNYIKLSDILKDRFSFIFVDEYQDTSPLVIEILLSFLSKSDKANIIGFFGDSMQAIYETGVGNINEYINNGLIKKVEKKQNRRNPNLVINLANKLRLDGLEQVPSDDETAPNMINGKVKEGFIKFLYTDDFNLDIVKSSSFCAGWDFSNSKKTKELRLTHNLIAEEAGFSELMGVYDADPIYKFKRDFNKEIKKRNLEINTEDTFDNIVTSIDWKYKRGENKGRHRKDVLLDNDTAKKLYEYIKDWPYNKVNSIYLNKDNLIDDKVVVDGVIAREPKRDRLIQHLFKIQEIIDLYQEKDYNEIIRRTSYKILKIEDKINLKKAIGKLTNMGTDSIENVIDFADKSRLCIIDDNLMKFIELNEYLYWRIKGISFSVFKKLYRYLEGFVPLSTQHKIKGLEFDNVLVVLHNGGWSNYNFEYLLYPDIKRSLTSSKQKSFTRILERTQKLFYVCCTRAKENLVVYCPDPTTEMIEGANNLFGKQNVKKL